MLLLRALVSFLILPGTVAGLIPAFHLRVVLYEEPRLKKQFGDEWASYGATVPRWMPGLPRRKSRKGGMMA